MAWRHRTDGARVGQPFCSRNHPAILILRMDAEVTMELASVIIPTFNSEMYICESIDSVLAQKYPCIEIIVVDDGSADCTVEIARQKLHGFARWQVIELGSNGGVSAARNAGLRAASGSWIQFLDSDDILMPEKIEHQMAVCVNASADVAAIYSTWSWGFLEDGRIEWYGNSHHPPSMAGKPPVMCLIAGCRPLLGSGLARRSALNAVGGFDEALRFWECEELNARIAEVGRALSVPATDPQYLWRLRRDGTYIGGQNARYNSKDVALAWIRLVLKATGGTGIYEQGLSEQDKELFLRECTLWGRVLCSENREAFQEFLSVARMLDPKIAPVYPPHISALSRCIGYEKAEGIAKLARQPRLWFRSMLYRLKLRRRETMIIELR